MVQIYNSDTIKRILEDAGIQTSHDQVPNKLSDKVVPVLISNPVPLIKLAFIDTSNDASQTIFTTSSTKDTYITSINLSIARDVTHDGDNTRIRATPFGNASKILFKLRYNALTAGSENGSIDFEHPIKLTKNTNVGIDNGTATANIDNTGIIYYYEV